MITIIENYNLADVKRELRRMLEEGSGLPEVRQLALQITAQIPYDNDQISAIYDFVKTNIRYQPDPYSVELFIHPRRMVEFYNQGIARGDCDDIALFTTSLLRSLGYEADVVLLNTAGEGLDHAVSQVSSNGVTLMLDPSANVPLGWEESYYQKVVV